MHSKASPRYVSITPSVTGDSALEAFLRAIDPQADIAAYLHEREPVIQPSTEVIPTDHQMEDGRTAYVFRMGRPPHCQRDFIVVVTSMSEALVASPA
jgi:hypothetical protein